MTGYAVVVRHDAARVEAATLRALMPSLRRRGPHGEHVVTDGPVGIATALLDVGDRLLAPAWVVAGSLHVAGQVRIDAREELVEELRWKGKNADLTDPDLRLFAQAWSAWGDEAPSRLLGDFSAVVYDRESRITTLVRDPFGVRMLFHHGDAQRLVASNTLATLLDAGVSRELDEDAIADFVAEGFNEDPSTTTFRAVKRVPPAHVVTVHPTGRTEARCYWTLPAPAIDRSRDAETIVADFRILLEAAVCDRMRTPKLTVFMSGGLDSTTLAALAARQDEDRTRVVARTAHLPTLAPSEDTARAKVAAQHIGIPHVLSDVDEYGYREGTALPIPETLEPSGDPDLLGLHDELRSASEHAPVAFWGEDPDAYLSPPHLAELLRASAPHRFVLDLMRHVLRERKRPYLGVRALVRKRRAASRVRQDAGGPAWLRADLRVRRAERVRSRDMPAHPTRSVVAERLAQYHWQPFLESLDAGFHGIPIDVRLPYLDLRLIHYALALPAMPWLQGKRLLREVARGLIPESVREAPKRGMPGLYEARIAQWWAREPAPFVPSAALARFVDVSKLPAVDRATSVNDLLVHLRLRALDRWLQAVPTTGAAD
jgi:asparagine synthase (glutamine-hydrolysing)